MEAKLAALAASLVPVLGKDEAAIEAKIKKLVADTKSLIKNTSRIANDESGIDALVASFDVEHQIQTATAFFQHFHHRAVIFGHKFQGKTQFLFFLAKLLQELGEGVLFLDPSIAPPDNFDETKVEDQFCCLHEWKTQLNEFLNTHAEHHQEAVDKATKALEEFAKGGKPKCFAAFWTALEKFKDATGARIWVLLDEAPNDAFVPVAKGGRGFPVVLPEEQVRSEFHFVVTGSSGMAQFVADRNLKNWVWDLPLFVAPEAAKFAQHLADELKFPDSFDLWDAVGAKKGGDASVDKTNLGEKLDELFGGVPGYIAQLMATLSQGGTLAVHTRSLQSRIERIVTKRAQARHLSDHNLAQGWLRLIQQPGYDWACVQDSGLCGRSAPRGVMLSFLLAFMCVLVPDEDDLKLVQYFREQFGDDPGLDGNLLELEQIIKFQRGSKLRAIRLEWDEDVEKWLPSDTQDLGGKLCLWTYDERTGTVNVRPGMKKQGAEWHGLLLCHGFHVLDFLLVRVSSASALEFYLVQITRSKKPFAQHNTNETCSETSKTSIKQLLKSAGLAISGKADTPSKIYYVMYAPNAEGDQFIAPDHKSPYYVSPSEKMPGAPKKRKGSVAVGFAAKKKLKGGCCKCKRGDCTKCKCKGKCTNCASPKCASTKS